ncbi:MAG: CapA family protein [Oscillospiraceae bacterium]|nr:CapA family protein [Oscillospiraceae bacterium]
MSKRFKMFIVIVITFLTILSVMPPALVLHYNDESNGGEDYDISNSSLTPVEREPVADPTPTPPPPTPQPTPSPEPTPEPIVTITLSAGGDVTVGGCPVNSSFNSYMRQFELQDKDFSFFFRNVRDIFNEDDLSIVNFEGTLTDATNRVDKRFTFRAPPEFIQVLRGSGIDAVTLANNHSRDFGEVSYQDTKNNLEAEGIAFFGNETNTIVNIKGINIGLFGFETWSTNDPTVFFDKITDAIEDLKSRGAALIIAYFHWGKEGSYEPNANQIKLGHFSIDNGVDLVLGAHPHVIQGIEVYNGKNIVYSLANFSFGGNRWPPDYDSFIFRQTFTFDNGVLQESNETEIIPIRVSSVSGENNYQPTPATGATAERISGEIKRLSDKLNN